MARAQAHAMPTARATRSPDCLRLPPAQSSAPHRAAHQTRTKRSLTY